MPNKEEELTSSQPQSESATKKAKAPKEKAKASVKPKISPAKTLKTDNAPKKSRDQKSKDVVVPVASNLGAEATGAHAAQVTNLSAGSGSGRKILVRIGVGIVALLLVALVVFGVMIYGYKSQNAVVKYVAGVVPYPAEMVNGRLVSYHEYLFEVDANERSYQNNEKLNNEAITNFSSASGKKLATQVEKYVLSQLEAEALIAQLAAENHVTVSNAEITAEINQLASHNGGQQTLLKVLNQTYGWNLSDLRSVIYKELLQQKLQTKVTTGAAAQTAALDQAQDVLKQVKSGGDFTALAQKYSQASDASSGGDLGNVSKSQLPVQEQSVVSSLPAGGVSNVIKTQYGYDIVKVVADNADGTYHVQHILIETTDFNTYFENQLKKAKVTMFVKAG